MQRSTRAADLRNGVGIFLVVIASLALFTLSASLSYLRFSDIAPPDMPWFTISAMSLTDLGLLLWVGILLLTRYHVKEKTIAILMVIATAIFVLFTDMTELGVLFHIVTIISGLFFYALIIMVAMHFVAFLWEAFIIFGRLFLQVEFNSDDRNLIPMQQGAYVQVYPEPELNSDVPELNSERGETVSPLAYHRPLRLKKAHKPSKIRALAYGVGSFLMSMGSSSIVSGEQVAHAHGQTNTNTSVNGSQNTGQPSTQETVTLEQTKTSTNFSDFVKQSLQK